MFKGLMKENSFWNLFAAMDAAYNLSARYFSKPRRT
jgi:hypothetical protein